MVHLPIKMAKMKNKCRECISKGEQIEDSVKRTREPCLLFEVVTQAVLYFLMLLSLLNISGLTTALTGRSERGDSVNTHAHYLINCRQACPITTLLSKPLCSGKKHGADCLM